MSRQWKPGDVATIPFGRGEVRAMYTVAGWAISDIGTIGKGFGGHRPLVVIDPEDREQCVRLTDAYIAASRGDFPARPNDGWMQTALRSLAAVPKPEEPTGLGAVVEDADGFLWTHARRNVSGWVSSNGIWREWDRVDAVKVLSEGVTP